MTTRRLIATAATIAFGATLAHGAIFLKEDATGAGDGSSWTDAFTTWADAMTAMRAIGNNGDATLYVAKGIYPAGSAELTDNGATTITNATFAIHGGCRADFDGDLARDPAAYQTLVTSYTKAGVLGAYWKRVTPKEGGYGYTTENVKVDGANFKLVGPDGCLQFPDFAGAHDTFQISASGGSIPVYIGGGASGVLDGIRFVCCNRGSSRSGVINVGKAGDITISNCVFAASCPQGGVINSMSAGSTGIRTIVDCKFLFNNTSFGTIGVNATFGHARVRNCAFVGNSQLNGYSMALLNIVANNINNSVDWVAEDCVFTRNLTSYTGNPGTQLIAGTGCFRRLVITNNYVETSSSSVPDLISLRNTRYAGSGLLADSLVADNAIVCRPASDTVGVMVSGHTTDRNSEPSVVNTVFRSNAILAPSNTVAVANSCALGIVGNKDFASRSTCMTVAGCAFVSNRVEVANLAEGATAVRSRGLLSYDQNTSRVQHGLANCTFFGPAEEGLYDVVQYGEQSKLLNVVNCVFALDDPDAVAAPFLSDSPSSLMVHDCAVQNWFPAFQPTGFGALDGVKPDPVPLEMVATGPGEGLAPRAASWTPGLRETCDIATNRPSLGENLFQPTSFSFRTRGDGAVWQKLVPSAPGAILASPEPTLDPLGDARPFGATTAGTLQALAPTAETGSSLTLRRDPFAGGTLSHPFNQSAATGTPFAPVTAIPSNGGSFLGWLDEAGNPFTAANPLELVAPATNLVLTASFGTAAVTLTFSLDNLGTFDGCGLATTSLVCSAGASFPEIPAFAVADGYVFATWGALPTTVPDEDTTYTAKIVTKELRRLYAAPDGTGDGTSWANAASLADAYEDAAIYRGEVWLKEGIYIVPAAMALRPNVAVIGGFAGDEASVDTADPDAHPAILNGNASGGLYWKPNGADPGAANRVAVWENGAFNPPNPGWTDNYWQPASPSPAIDAPYAFTEGLEGVPTNAVFRGVTFTGFSRCAIYSPSGAADGLVIERCRFLANGTGASTDYATVQVESSPFTLRDCDFVGNFRVLRQIFSRRPFTNEVADCRFLDNVGGGFSTTISTNGSFTVDRCLFARNYSAGTAPVLALNSTRHFGPARFADCAVVSNRLAKGASALFAFTCSNSRNGSDYYGVPCLEISRCDFSDNIANETTALCFFFTGRYASIPVRDCHFAGNVHTNSASAGLLYYDNGYGMLTFVNCLVERNSITTTAGSTGLVLVNNAYSRSAVIGCTFADNAVTASNPGNAADINVINDNATGAHTIVNTVFDEAAGGQKPVKGCAPSPIDLWNTFTRGQGTNTMGEATLSVRNHSSEDPRILPLTRRGPNGLPGRPVGSASPAARGALAVQRGSNGNYYVYRPWVTGNNAKPWIAPGVAELTAAQGAAQGLDPAAPSIPDTWGQPRRATGYSCGHVNAARANTVFFVK